MFEFRLGLLYVFGMESNEMTPLGLGIRFQATLVWLWKVRTVITDVVYRL